MAEGVQWAEWEDVVENKHPHVDYDWVMGNRYAVTDRAWLQDVL